MKIFERYLGDGVYAHYDGFQIWLTTLEGHQIALEAQVFAALGTYVVDLNLHLKAVGEPPA
jgi:hypothetical protein